MNVGVLRWAFAGFWLAVAVLLAYFGHFGPDGFADRLGVRSFDLGAAFASAMAAWNVVRWYMARPRSERVAEPPSTGRGPLEPRVPPEQRAEEYLPEFDFTKPDGERP